MPTWKTLVGFPNEKHLLESASTMIAEGNGKDSNRFTGTASRSIDGIDLTPGMTKPNSAFWVVATPYIWHTIRVVRRTPGTFLLSSRRVALRRATPESTLGGIDICSGWLEPKYNGYVCICTRRGTK